MSRTATQLALLGLAVMTAACQQHYDLPLQAPTVSATEVTFSWNGDAARSVTVYRCPQECPATSTLPRYGEEKDTRPGEVVWDISGVGSPADGAGTIASPLVYGDADHPSAMVKTPPSQLVPGQYLLRVVIFEAAQMKAHIGTGWSTFTVPDENAASFE